MKKNIVIVSLVVLVVLLASCLVYSFVNKDSNNNVATVDNNKDSSITVKTNNMPKTDPKIMDEFNSAVLSNDIEKVLVHINKDGVNVNSIDSQGVYPIQRALLMENCQMVELLLQKGLDLNIVAENGKKICDIIKETNNKYLIGIMDEYK